jgi:hypothetical protein
MLMVTMSILGGLSLVSMQSIRSASNMLAQGSQAQAQDAGLLFTVLSVQSNTSGAYVWLYNYGWSSGRVTEVFLDGGIVSGWSSSCPTIKPGSLCVVHLPQRTGGSVTIQFGSKNIVVSS